MGATEQAAAQSRAFSTSRNHDNENNTTHHITQLPKSTSSASSLEAPPPKNNLVNIPTATHATPNANKNIVKIRRAFTMPRNPFRWSRKFKTNHTNAADFADGDGCSLGGSNSALTSCVGGGRGRAGSIISLKCNDAINKDVNGHDNQIVEKGLGFGSLVAAKGDDNDDSTCGVSNYDSNDSEKATHGLKEKSECEIGEKQINKNRAQNSTAAMVTVTTIPTTITTTNTSSTNRIFRRSSFRKFINRIAQHVSNSVNIGTNKQKISLNHHNQAILNTDRVPPIGGYQWPPDQIPGVTGLKNHGNTCFMNAVLQCLSHTDILAEYFVLDQYKADLKRRNKINSRKFGTKGELTEQLANVLKALWMCKNESDHSTSFKAVVDRYGSQFRSSTQHDAQEFLFWLLDKVHEDLNMATKRKYKSVKNSYGRPDEIIAAETLANHIRCNNSFVQAVFQAQFRSSLTCPRCKKQSNTFDPFHCISVQLPQLLQQNIFVTVVYLNQKPNQVRIGLRVPAGSPIVALREQLQIDTGIASECMVLLEMSNEGFARVFYDTQPIDTLKGIETIYCLEVPEFPAKDKTTKVNDNVTNNQTKYETNDETTTPTVSTVEVPTDAKSTATTVTNKSNPSSELLLLVANVRKKSKVKEKNNHTEQENNKNEHETILERFGSPFSMRAPSDCSYVELQRRILREMSVILKPAVLTCSTPLTGIFQIRLQCPSADPDSYIEKVEHPLLTEMIDLALSVLAAEAGPAHVKLVLEWEEPEKYFDDLSDAIVEHESVAKLQNNKQQETQTLTLEQCLEHYTKAETLSAEDAWRCPHCQKYLPVVKTLGLWSLPDILVVHFKRFRTHQEKGANAAKLTTMVNFPLNAFDMSPHLVRGVGGVNGSSNCNSSANLSASTASAYANDRPNQRRRTAWSIDSRSSTLNSRDNRETRYDLYAVCYHQGDTLETGHYTAACKNPYDHQWYKFDDQRVSKVPNENINDEIVNNEAYMLFYQRRNDNGECSGSSSNSGGDHWVCRLPPPPGATPVQFVEKFTATSEKLITPKSEEAKILEEPRSETTEIKFVDVPKVQVQVDMQMLSAIKEAPPILTALHGQQNTSNEDFETQSAATVATVKPNIIDVLKLDFADADEVQITPNESPMSASDPNQTVTTKKLNEKSLLTAIISEAQPLQSAKAQSPCECKTIQIQGNIHAHVGAVSLGNGLETVTATAATTNGHKNNNGTSYSNSNKAISPIIENGNNRRPNSGTDYNSNSASSSSSSLSSRSSPHELSTSINGASNLQHKFNGYVTHNTYHASFNGHRDVFLSSSLKGNSSSFITANGIGGSGGVVSSAFTVNQNEFQLSCYQRQNWNGSRFSVSAVESATNSAQAHGLNLRHSLSTSSNYKLRECNDTLSSLLRNSGNTCSKDTLLFIDQQTHHHHANSLLEDEDDSFMDSRSLWISPVTPHKLITVSPKN